MLLGCWRAPNHHQIETGLLPLQSSGEPIAHLTHPSAENLNAALTGSKGLEEGRDGRSTPKAKLIFDLQGGRDDVAQRKWADANPFEAQNGEDNASDFSGKPWKCWREAGFSKGKRSTRSK
jgi:hypothetical protein